VPRPSATRDGGLTRSPARAAIEPLSGFAGQFDVKPALRARPPPLADRRHLAQPYPRVTCPAAAGSCRYEHHPDPVGIRDSPTLHSVGSPWLLRCPSPRANRPFRLPLDDHPTHCSLSSRKHLRVAERGGERSFPAALAPPLQISGSGRIFADMALQRPTLLSVRASGYALGGRHSFHYYKTRL
jgi:hypothetical protein